MPRTRAPASEARSSHCASSTTQSSGWSSATSVNRVSAASPTRNRFGSASALRPKAAESASCCGPGSRASRSSIGAQSWCSPANGSSISDWTPAARATRKPGRPVRPGTPSTRSCRRRARRAGPASRSCRPAGLPASDRGRRTRCGGRATPIARDRRSWALHHRPPENRGWRECGHGERDTGPRRVRSNVPGRVIARKWRAERKSPAKGEAHRAVLAQAWGRRRPTKEHS